MSHYGWENELSELIVRMLDGCLSENEFNRLETILVEDPAAVEFYAKAIITNALLVDKSCIPISEDDVDQESELTLAERPLDSEVGVAKQGWTDTPLGEIERLATREFERFREQERQRQEELAYREYCARRRRNMVAASSMVALVAIVFMAWLIPLIRTNQSEPTAPAAQMKPALVATLIKAKNARWASDALSTAVNTRLAVGSLHLKEGLAEILLDDGAVVLLQAPCELNLESAGRMALVSGAISATVPPRGVGFEVETPTGIVKDYGTEFGILTTSTGKTETHVYQGRVTLRSTAVASSSSEARELLANEAATVDESGHVQDTPFRARRFIREITDQPGVGIPGIRLSLADIVAGGNGLGLGTYGTGLYPADGAVIPERKGGDAGSGQGFMPVPFLDFVDGVFVPDGGQGPITVSTTGTTFASCPDTTGQCHSGILSRATFASSDGSSQGLHSGELLGRRYDTAQQPSIGMHANSGLTIDLDEIRSTMAGVEIVRFHSLCGISSTVVPSIEASDNKEKIEAVSFWVLVDGQERFRRQNLSRQPESIEIDVSLRPDDRFLTLMTTTPGPIMFCWGMLAEPYLELSSSFK